MDWDEILVQGNFTSKYNISGIWDSTGLSGSRKKAYGNYKDFRIGWLLLEPFHALGDVNERLKATNHQYKQMWKPEGFLGRI